MKKNKTLNFSKEFTQGFNSVFDVFLMSPTHKKVEYVPKTRLDDYANLNDDLRKTKVNHKELIYGK